MKRLRLGCRILAQEIADQIQEARRRDGNEQDQRCHGSTYRPVGWIGEQIWQTDAAEHEASNDCEQRAEDVEERNLVHGESLGMSRRIFGDLTDNEQHHEEHQCSDPKRVAVFNVHD